jgi:signal transduction histidine kinase
MKPQNKLQNNLLFSAKKLHHYNELLITQCNNWLPEEEGNKNMEKRIVGKKQQNNQMKNYLLLLVVLLFAIGCNRVAKNNVVKNENFTLQVDSLWAPTGDMLLDSLLQVASTAPKDTNLAKLYCDIGEMYENMDFEKAKEYYLKLKNISEQLTWNEGIYLYAIGFTNLLSREGLTDSAVVILQKAHELAVREKNEARAVNMIVCKGNAYFSKEWFETALTCYMEALPFYENKHSKEQLQSLYYMMSQLYRCINATEQAIEYGEKAVDLNREDPFALCALAIAYSYAHRYEQAKAYHEEALRLATVQNNIYLMGVLYYHIANDALFGFDLNKAEKYMHELSAISQQFGSIGYGNDLIILSKLEQLKGNYEKAEEYAQQALQIATEFETLEEKKYCYLLLAELAITQGNYRKNIQYWEECDLVEIDIAHKTAIRSSEEMSAKYETAKKEVEIERQQLIIEQQKIQHWLLIGGGALCILALLLLWYMLHLRTRRNHVLAEMNATKDKFFSIISHDLKNPAIVQRDSIKVLINNMSSLDNKTITEYLNEILLSAEIELELLYNLLNWAQVQTGRMSFMPATVNLASCLRSEITLIQEMAKNKNITFTSHIPDEALVFADRNMIATVVRNLLTNAVKFTDPGGTIMLSISSENKKVASNTSTIISVTDTGIGIDETQIRNLFRLDSAHSSKGTANESGSGLGLLVCKEMLEKHGSILHVESEKRKGSRFWFELKN